MDMQNNENPTATKCLSCQYEAQATMTDRERNHWMLWGCTCTPEAAEEARTFIGLVTR